MLLTALHSLETILCECGGVCHGTYECPPVPDISMASATVVQLRQKAYLRQSNIFKLLGNHGAAFASTWAGYIWANEMTPSDSPLLERHPAIATLRKELSPSSFLKRRYPDPADLNDMKISHPNLQVRGIWSQIRIGGENGPKPKSRLAMGSVIWKGEFLSFCYDPSC